MHANLPLEVAQRLHASGVPIGDRRTRLAGVCLSVKPAVVALRLCWSRIVKGQSAMPGIAGIAFLLVAAFQVAAVVGSASRTCVVPCFQVSSDAGWLEIRAWVDYLAYIVGPVGTALLAMVIVIAVGTDSPRGRDRAVITASVLVLLGGLYLVAISATGLLNLIEAIGLIAAVAGLVGLRREWMPPGYSSAFLIGGGVLVLSVSAIAVASSGQSGQATAILLSALFVALHACGKCRRSKRTRTLDGSSAVQPAEIPVHTPLKERVFNVIFVAAAIMTIFVVFVRFPQKVVRLPPSVAVMDLQVTSYRGLRAAYLAGVAGAEAKIEPVPSTISFYLRHESGADYDFHTFELVIEGCKPFPVPVVVIDQPFRAVVPQSAGRVDRGHVVSSAPRACSDAAARGIRVPLRFPMETGPADQYHPDFSPNYREYFYLSSEANSDRHLFRIIGQDFFGLLSSQWPPGRYRARVIVTGTWDGTFRRRIPMSVGTDVFELLNPPTGSLWLTPRDFNWIPQDSDESLLGVLRGLESGSFGMAAELAQDPRYRECDEILATEFKLPNINCWVVDRW